MLLSQLVKVTVEVSELIWEDVGIGNDVEGLLAEALLHLDDVCAKPIFPRQLEAVWEMIDLLILIHVVVNVGLVALARPEQVPVVRLRLLEAVALEDRPEQLGLAPHQLEEHLVRVVRDVLVQYGSLLEVQCTLAVSNENGRVLERPEVDKLRLQIILDVLRLLLRTTDAVVLYVRQVCDFAG